MQLTWQLHAARCPVRKLCTQLYQPNAPVLNHITDAHVLQNIVVLLVIKPALKYWCKRREACSNHHLLYTSCHVLVNMPLILLSFAALLLLPAGACHDVE
jgi:hypothetical protein